MSEFVSPKAAAYAGMAVIGTAAGLILREPVFIIFVAPLLAALALGFALRRLPMVAIDLAVDRGRVMEGETVELVLTLRAAEPVSAVEVALRAPPGLEAEGGAPLWAIDLSDGADQQLTQTLVCPRWGGYSIGHLRVRVRDAFGFFVHESWRDFQLPIRVYPQPSTVQTLVSPATTHLRVGSDVARSRGEGLEFADIRAYGSGDRIRRINWRMSSRRQELFVNDYHRELNHNVVLLLDTFGETGGSSRFTLERSVRAAAALADHYLKLRDQVGVVGFGGRINWLHPETGERQRYRIIESLIEAQAMVNFADRAIDIVPRKMLPPNALVIALSPLQDERIIAALFNLHGRRFDLAIVEIGAADPVMEVTPRTDLARRIWTLERDAMRERFRQLGVPVAVWQDETHLETVMQEVQAFRRYARRPSA